MDEVTNSRFCWTVTICAYSRHVYMSIYKGSAMLAHIPSCRTTRWKNSRALDYL